ncbi:hypothetical protein F4779DRAFT_572748 [Xylariaceae sp. FL0662B]|nr:hypothetical protein F4779DRAFT_572748 [Xylariaceae sp. FL0662B]
MQQRRSHKKSRRGCQNCKKWHVKCDERGPPCTNCSLRKAECAYSWMKPNETQSSLSLRPKDARSHRPPVARPQGSVVSVCAPYGGPSRLLELELMHLWSTKTYHDMCCTPEDFPYMQYVLPREAIKYDFMMDGLFAMSAIQLASQVKGRQAAMYVNAATEYFNKGSNSFRTHLSNLNRDNCHVLYMFSAIAVTTNIAIRQFTRPASEGMIALVKLAFDLLNGSSTVALAAQEWIYESPLPVRALVSRLGAPKEFIDASTREALARLSLINDTRHKAVGEIAEEAGGEESKIKITGYDESSKHEMYKKAVACLELCFAEEGRGVLRNFSSAFPSIAGPEFCTAFRQSEPFAMLIVMHWAVLTGRLDTDFEWWTDIGPSVVTEILDFLQRLHPHLVLEWESSISWVLGRIGLPRLQQRLIEM